MGTGAFVNILFEKSLDFRRIHTAFRDSASGGVMKTA
jgi:hypothetical protein